MILWSLIKDGIKLYDSLKIFLSWQSFWEGRLAKDARKSGIGRYELRKTDRKINKWIDLKGSNQTNDRMDNMATEVDW